MKIFFYCSYDSSERGFVLSEMTREGLRQIDETALPQTAADFLNYDHFRILWRDIPACEQPERHNLQISGSICGIRDLSGRSADGRMYYANVVFVCTPDEVGMLQNLMSHILYNYRAFEAELISCLRIGGSCGYLVDEKTFFEWLEPRLQTFITPVPTDSKDILLCDIFADRQQIRTEPELLRFGVMKVSWRSISPYFGRKLCWLFCPRQVIDSNTFETFFD